MTRMKRWHARNGHEWVVAIDLTRTYRAVGIGAQMNEVALTRGVVVMAHLWRWRAELEVFRCIDLNELNRREIDADADQR